MTDDPAASRSAGGPIGANPSFFDLVRETVPRRSRPLWAPAGRTARPHGTTVLGLKFEGGVVFAGDPRATEGYTIADDKMEKVFAADDYSAIAIAGVAGQAIEIVKLFQLELEHYEKITGDRLSLEGKANRLAQMIRGNFPWPSRAWSSCRCSAGSTSVGTRAGSSTTTPQGAGGKRTTTRPPGRAAIRRRARSRSGGGLGCPGTKPSGWRWRPWWMRPRRMRRPAGPDPARGIFPTISSWRPRCLRGSGRRGPLGLRSGGGSQVLMAFMPYVPPEQLMKDRSDFAHKGIARGKSVVGLEYADGILFIAENPSATLHKISEIYDRIAFAGVGKYSEFEDLRIAGVRLADLRGYSYGREDVRARDIANGYSQALSTIFTQQMKPYEVEILVAR